MKKIIITGANGFVAQAIIAQLDKEPDIEIHGISKGLCRLDVSNYKKFHYHPLDITDGLAVNKIVTDIHPDFTIHCAAISHADLCETDKPFCWQTNVTATRFLIDAAKLCHAGFCLLSTNFVFDGENGPYTENNFTNPIMYYGSSKLAAEKALLESGIPNAFVARTVLVYGKKLPNGRHNLLTWAYENLQQNKPIKVVCDQLRTPTYVHDLAKGIIALMNKNAKGIYHLSGTEVLTPYEMVMRIASQFNMDSSLIEKVDASSFKEVATRPLKGGFICTKAKNETGFLPTPFTKAMAEIFE